VLWKFVPIYNGTSGLAEPEVGIMGVDPGRIDAFDGIRDLNGDKIDIAALSPNEIVVNEEAVDALDAKVGDTLTIFYNNQPVELTVAAIAKTSVLSGSVDLGSPGVVLSLNRLQEITGLTDRYSVITISNAGGVRDSMGHTDAVVT
jgi:ABC-type lipoprotein release transport system permease subunit